MNRLGTRITSTAEGLQIAIDCTTRGENGDGDMGEEYLLVPSFPHLSIRWFYLVLPTFLCIISKNHADE